MGEGEEERGEEHLAGKLTVGENSGDRCPDHPNQKIKRHTKRAPGALETVADEPQKPERDGDPQRVSRPRNENVGDEPPNFTGANARDIEGEIRIKALVEEDKNEDERVQGHNGTDQSGDRDEAKTPFEFVQEAHRRTHGRGGEAALQAERIRRAPA